MRSIVKCNHKWERCHSANLEDDKTLTISEVATKFKEIHKPRMRNISSQVKLTSQNTLGYSSNEASTPLLAKKSTLRNEKPNKSQTKGLELSQT